MTASVPDQIKALEELAAIDAELKTLGDDLQQERGALDAQRKKLEGARREARSSDRAQLAAIDKRATSTSSRCAR